MIADPTPTRPRVAVFGGGMGGLACAHELARQGVSVQLYEGSNFLGGKARSQFIPGTGRGGRGNLPGEHGFRFYPGFYRHVIASMLEIPDPLSPTGTVAGNLVGTTEAGVAAPGIGRDRDAPAPAQPARRCPRHQRHPARGWVGGRSGPLPGGAPQVPDLLR